MTVPKELLDLLVCVTCHTKVELTANQQGLLCPQCRLVYPIRDGIPVMLTDQAVPLEVESNRG